MAEGRRPVEGKVSSNTCSGLSAGLNMSLKQRACGSVASKPTITFDLRRESGAGKLTRATLIYLALGMEREDRSRAAQGGPGSLSMPMMMDTFDDEWKR